MGPIPFYGARAEKISPKSRFCHEANEYCAIEANEYNKPTVRIGLSENMKADFLPFLRNA